MPLFGTILLLAALSSQTAQTTQPLSETLIGKNFVVSFPKSPSHSKLGEPGIKDVTAQQWSVQSADAYYCVIYDNVGEGMIPFEEMQGKIDGTSCQDDYNNLLSEQETVMNGWPELDIKFRREDNHLVEEIRFVETDHELLQLQATFGQGKDTRPAESDAFFKSLKVTGTFTKGVLTENGPILKKYPLGDSGIFAKFPHKPTVTSSDDVPFDLGTAMIGARSRLVGFTVQKSNSADDSMAYVSDYADRLFLVGFGSLTTHELNKEKDAAMKIVQAVAGSAERHLKGSDLETSWRKLGANDALYFRCKFGAGLRMQGVALIDHGRLVTALALGPKIFLDSPLFNDFINSLEFSK